MRERARKSSADANVSGLPAGGADQQLQRFPHRYIVVDDEHNRGIVRDHCRSRFATCFAR